jgi:hypothetical protein
MGDEAPVRPAAGGVSDDATLAATGRRSADWFGMLDQAGARDWSHTQIAAYLIDTIGVDGWWSQSITVAYEQATGRRRPGQQHDGTFTASVSRRVAGDRREVFDRLLPHLIRHFGQPLSTRPEATSPGATWAPDPPTESSRERVVADVRTAATGRVTVTLSWSKMPDEHALSTVKERLAKLLDSLP